MTLFDNAPVTKTPSVKFPEIGSKVVGEIVRISEPMQAREFSLKGDGAPAVWSSGRPKMQICVTINTGEIDPSIEDHAGEYGLWVLNDFSRADKTLFPDSMLNAIQKAVQAAGAEDLEVGGTLEVEFYKEDPESKNPKNPRKMYRAKYRKPAAGGGAFRADNGAAEEESKPAVKSAQNGSDGLSEEQKERARTMLTVGADPARIAKTMGVDVSLINALASDEDIPAF